MNDKTTYIANFKAVFFASAGFRYTLYKFTNEDRFKAAIS